MKRLLEIQEYFEDVKRVASLDLPWGELDGKTIAITGGTGLIGSFLIDVLRTRFGSGNQAKVLLLGRNEEKARVRFAEYWGDGFLEFEQWSARGDAHINYEHHIDYLIHLASNTHPVAYATDPIGTIVANVIALNSLLADVSSVGCKRFLFASSNEIYGENRGDVELFDEQYCGYIDCNTLRAGYPESKRCGEALCQAYKSQKGMDIVIARLTRTFGPTILPTDTKAISQFFMKALRGEDIVLKSDGSQYYSYQYVSDSVAGLLTVLLKGVSGEAYNIADESGDVRLKDLAILVADQARRSVVFDLPDKVEAAGFSKATKVRLNGAKIRALGWRPAFGIEEACARNYKILKELTNA